MAGTLTVRITESLAEIRDLRYRYIWSARLDGKLLGQGHAYKPEVAIAQAQELVDPEDIEDMDVDYRGRGGFLPLS